MSKKLNRPISRSIFVYIALYVREGGMCAGRGGIMQVKEQRNRQCVGE